MDPSLIEFNAQSEIGDPIFPCKCGHLLLAHDIYEDRYGGWVWMDDVQEEVWQEESVPRPICYACNLDCQYEQMTNLEYLEFKSNGNNTSK